MPKIESHTSVDEIIQCKDIPGFIIKKIDLGGKYIQTPIKSIYLSTEIPSNIRKELIKIKEKSTIFELNRVIYQDRSYNSLNTTLKDGNEVDIKKVLKVNDSFDDDLLIPFSFSKFPNKALSPTAFNELLDWIHSYSLAPFVPNVRFDNKGTKKSCTNYEAKTFCKYVDYAVNELNDRNSKPIFVPLDIEYNANLRNEILQHYSKMGYTNIWIDFKGKVISKSILTRIRGIIKGIGKIFDEDDVNNIVIHFANIKKIPNEPKDDTKVRPSDTLGVFIYGDIIGTPWRGIPYISDISDIENTWRKKGFPSKEDYLKFLFKRDSSIFDAHSYYYRSPDIIAFNDRTLENIRGKILEFLHNKQFDKKSLAEKLSYVISGVVAQEEFNIMKDKVEESLILRDLVTNFEFFKDDYEGKELINEFLDKKFRKNDNQMTLDLI